MGAILDHFAAAETYPELVDIQTKTVFKGFKKVHVAVGTSDLSTGSDSTNFWYLDTEEIMSFLYMMRVLACAYTLTLWNDLGFMRFATETSAPDGGFWYGTYAWVRATRYSPIPTGSTFPTYVIERWILLFDVPSQPTLLAQIHLACLVAGWTALILISISVAIHQFVITHRIFGCSPPELVQRTSACPWIPRHNFGSGIKKVPIYETKPRAFCFCAPIHSIHDGNCLYSHSELIDDVVFGQTVPEKLRKIRESWKERLHRWYPPSVCQALDWVLARRTILEDPYSGAITKPKPNPGRFFIDVDPQLREDAPSEVMKGKELRRMLWILLILPALLCSLVELYTFFFFRLPPSLFNLATFAVALVSNAVIFWVQFSAWGAKKLEARDRAKEDSENVFSKRASHHA